jgi:hypothetical protein
MIEAQLNLKLLTPKDRRKYEISVRHVVPDAGRHGGAHGLATRP